MLKQAHLYIKGDVIGIGFRAWTKIQAKIQGVAGWVKNNHIRPEIFGPGGGVEALFQGEEEKVNKIIQTVEEGPPIAHIDNVEIMWQEPKEIFEGFEIRK